MKLKNDDLIKALYLWSSEIKLMITEEPSLNQFEFKDINKDKSNEGLINIQIRNQTSSSEEWMSKEDLKLVTQAMQQDLSMIIDWYKDTEDVEKYGQPIPSHHMSNDRTYW